MLQPLQNRLPELLVFPHAEAICPMDFFQNVQLPTYLIEGSSVGIKQGFEQTAANPGVIRFAMRYLCKNKLETIFFHWLPCWLLHGACIA